MAGIIHDVARRLHQALEKKPSPAADLNECGDLVDRLAEEALKMRAGNAVDPALLKCLAAVSKSLRLRKRGSASWAPLLGRVTGIVEQLQHKRTTSPSTSGHGNAASAVKSSSYSSYAASSTKGDSAHGLPKTVTEYHDRLKVQKKEIYKNPPVLPPHSVRIESANAAPPPKRSANHQLLSFEPGNESDAPTQEFIHKFLPNVTPAEVVRGGAFGGTYFRPIASAVTNVQYSAKDVLRTTVLPEWIDGMDVKLQLTSSTYRNHVNKYGVKCGGSLGMWEVRTSRNFGRTHRLLGQFVCGFCELDIQFMTSQDDSLHELTRRLSRSFLSHYGSLDDHLAVLGMDLGCRPVRLVPVVLPLLPGPAVLRRRPTNLPVARGGRTRGTVPDPALQQDPGFDKRRRRLERCQHFARDPTNARALGSRDHEGHCRAAAEEAKAVMVRDEVREAAVVRTGTLLFPSLEAASCLVTYYSLIRSILHSDVLMSLESASCLVPYFSLIRSILLRSRPSASRVAHREHQTLARAPANSRGLCRTITRGTVTKQQTKPKRLSKKGAQQ
jgi:hypothetical protein